MFHKILVALDTSERAPGVFDMAVGMARMAGARLYVMRVVTVPAEFPPAAAGSPADPLAAQMAGRAMHDLSRLIAGGPDDVAIQPPIVRLGAPWKTILETAEDRDVDLIVVGSHGYRGWDHVLGTTAGMVANSSKRNVLVVHEQGPGTKTRIEGPAQSDATPTDEADGADAGVRHIAKRRRIIRYIN